MGPPLMVSLKSGEINTHDTDEFCWSRGSRQLRWQTAVGQMGRWASCHVTAQVPIQYTSELTDIWKKRKRTRFRVRKLDMVGVGSYRIFW